MIRPLIVAFFLLVTVSAIAQNTHSNEVFGFSFQVPEEWNVYGIEEFNTENNSSEYAFLLPMSNNGFRRESPWNHSVKVAAYAVSDVRTLQEAKNFIFEANTRLDLQRIKETENTWRFAYQINDEEYKSLIHVFFENNIIYEVSYSGRTSMKVDSDALVQLVTEQLSFAEPQVDYSDLDFLIENPSEEWAAAPEYLKAERAFAFQNFDLAVECCTDVIDKYGFYDEAFYLRALCHLELGDTVAACADFQNPDFEIYGAPDSLKPICDSEEMKAAIRKFREPEPLFEFDPSANPMAYIDSVKTHKYFIMSSGPNPSEEMISYFRHLSHLFQLEYDQLDSLVYHSDELLQLYSYFILHQKYPEQVTKEHRKQLDPNFTVAMNGPLEANGTEVKVKELLKDQKRGMEKMKERKKMQLKSETAVQKFIEKYAAFPETYVSLGFEDFRNPHIIDENGKMEKGSETYHIVHHYILKDTTGNEEEHFHYFKLTNKVEVYIIEFEETNIISSSRPEVKEWLQQFGRELSAKEKALYLE